MLRISASPATRDAGPSAALLVMLSIGGGALVANIYYAQPLLGLIAPEIGITPDLAGAIVNMTQIGYGLGLFLLVCLADRIENKKLILGLISMTVAALVGVARSKSAAGFFIATMLVGLCSTAAQVLLPLVAHLVPAERRGRTVGNVMAGVLTGIMLARPMSSFIAASFGWRAVFWSSALLLSAIGGALAVMMPPRRPGSTLSYGRMIASMATLLRAMPVLRRRCLYQASMFCGYNLFWTAAPLVLAERMGLDQRGIGLFALAGVGGALAAPFAGRLADRGRTSVVTAVAMIAITSAYAATSWAVATLQIVCFAVLGIVIDAAVQSVQVVSQRIIFSGPAETRGRVNAIFTTLTFIGGAIGSITATMTYQLGGWHLTSATGAVLGIATLAVLATERRYK